MECLFPMKELQLLKVYSGRKQLVSELLSLAPNLKMLILSEPRDDEFNLEWHPTLRKVWLENNKRVKLRKGHFEDLEVACEDGSY